MASSPSLRPRRIADVRAEMDTIDPEDFRAALRARIEAAAALNAFTVVADEAVHERTPVGRGPPSGVPFAVKDNIDALPFPTTGGSPALRNLTPPADAPAVARVRAAGAVMIGKTNLHELAFGVTSNNAFYGPVRNPFDSTRVAGGIVGWERRRGGRGRGSLRARHRHRRIGPNPGGVLRHRRLSPEHRPLSRGRGAHAVIDARHDRRHERDGHAGLDADRLPVGLQIDGAVGADRHLLAVATALEAMLGRDLNGGSP